MENSFYPNYGSPGYVDRDEWLNELQRRFSADLEKKSEVFNTNPHVEGCSSESEEEVSICRENNSSIYAPCSGLKSRERTTVDNRIDDLYRIVKLHSQQMNLLQTQIQSLVNLIKNSSLESKCQCNCSNQNVSKTTSFERPGNPIVENLHLPNDVSEVLPRCTFDPNLMTGMTQNEQNFFSTVMGTLRGILSESDLEMGQQTNPETSNSAYDGAVGNVDKTMLNATLEQLKRLGVSFIESRSPGPKKVTFCESSPPKSESSVEMDSLARKYLVSGPDERRSAQVDSNDRRKRHADVGDRLKQAADEGRVKRMDAAFCHIQNLQKKTTDLSLATLKYLKRYKLGAKGVDESAVLPKRADHRNEPTPATGKILDSIAIRSQPKLSNHNQWLRK